MPFSSPRNVLHTQTAAFAIVPVPVCLLVAIAVMIFGTDHPNGAWKDRHEVPAAHLEIDPLGHPVMHSAKPADVEKNVQMDTTVVPVDDSVPEGGVALNKTESITTGTTTSVMDHIEHEKKQFRLKMENVIEEESGSFWLYLPRMKTHSSIDVTSQLDVAINEKLTWRAAGDILMSPLTWLPSLAYLSTSLLIPSFASH